MIRFFPLVSKFNRTRMTYRPSDVAIVQVNPRVNILSALAGVEQETGELEAEIHIVRAAAPAPVAQRRRRRVVATASALALGIAAARLQFALTASLGDGVSHSSR